VNLNLGIVSRVKLRSVEKELKGGGVADLSKVRA